MSKWVILCQNERGTWSCLNDRIGVDECEAMLEGISLVSSFYTKDAPQAIVDLMRIRSVLLGGSVCAIDVTETRQ